MTALTEGVELMDFSAPVVSLQDYAELKAGVEKIMKTLQQMAIEHDHRLKAEALLKLLANDYNNKPEDHCQQLKEVMRLAAIELAVSHGVSNDELAGLIE